MGKMENANAVKYIRKMYLASGKSRLIYSFVNILFIGLAVALSVAVYFSFNFMLNENFIAGLLLLIVTIALLFFLFVQGGCRSAVTFVLLFDRYVSKRREGISNRCFLSLPHFHRCCYSHGRILALLVRLLKR